MRAWYMRKLGSYSHTCIIFGYEIHKFLSFKDLHKYQENIVVDGKNMCEELLTRLKHVMVVCVIGRVYGQS